MTDFSETIMIQRDPDAVWDLVGAPERINEWLPFIATSRVDGDRRFCSAANGAELEERIVDRNDAARSYQYTIESSPMPIEQILATVAVAPAGTEHTLVTWHTAVEPGELAEMFAPIYREGLENLKSMLEG